MLSASPTFPAAPGPSLCCLRSPSWEKGECRERPLGETEPEDLAVSAVSAGGRGAVRTQTQEQCHHLFPLTLLTPAMWGFLMPTTSFPNLDTSWVSQWFHSILTLSGVSRPLGLKAQPHRTAPSTSDASPRPPVLLLIDQLSIKGFSFGLENSLKQLMELRENTP